MGQQQGEGEGEGEDGEEEGEEGEEGATGTGTTTEEPNHEEESNQEEEEDVFEYEARIHLHRLLLSKATQNIPLAFAPLDGDGRTLLHGVARLGSLQLVKDLIELFGACAFAEDAHGVTPTEYARARGFDDV